MISVLLAGDRRRCGAHAGADAKSSPAPAQPPAAAEPSSKQRLIAYPSRYLRSSGAPAQTGARPADRGAERRPGPGATSTTGPWRGLDAKHDVAVAVPDADPRRTKDVVGGEALGQGACRFVTGGARRGHDTPVVIAVRVGERATRLTDLPLARLARSIQLSGQARVVELRQPRVRARVRSDFPARIHERRHLGPGHGQS